MANNQILKQRKQTYPFKTMKIGDTFIVKQLKYNSMLTSWRYHNKRFDYIEISAKPSEKGVIVTRVA